MQEEHKIIGEIMAKYPVLTAEEQRILNEWLAIDGNQQRFDSIVDNDARRSDLSRYLQIKERKEANRERYHAAIEEIKEERKVTRWNGWRIYLAAASVIIALSLIGYKWFGEKKQAPEVATTAAVKVNDVGPGKFRAKLVLADGSIVLLDSAGNKLLAQQGNTIVRNKDGKLVYEGKEGAPASGSSAGTVLYNTLSTSRGEMFTTILADGSKVWLNSQSSIHYPVNPGKNQIDITITGEAYFDIVHNPHRQVTITVNGMSIEDIGTQFNVNAYTDEENIKTTLIDGSVKVKKGTRQVIVKHGQQAIAAQSQEDNTVNVIDNADLEKVVAWKNGQFSFNKDDLKTVMRQLSRWYSLDIVYQGAVPKGQFIGIIPRSYNLSQVLEILESSDVHFKIEGKKLIVSP